MVLLTVDTSGQFGSLALAHIEDGNIAGQQQTQWTKKAMHSEIATVQLQELLSDTGTELKKLTHLAVNVGPGSFTGLRVGISMVKTLAYSLSIPVAKVNSLELQAFLGSKPGEKVFVANKAVQTFYYCARFDRTQTGVNTSLSPRSADQTELSALAHGCHRSLVEGTTQGFRAITEAKDIVSYLVANGFRTTFSDWKTIEPLYLRASEAEEKLKKGLLKPI